MRNAFFLHTNLILKRKNSWAQKNQVGTTLVFWGSFLVVETERFKDFNWLFNLMLIFLTYSAPNWKWWQHCALIYIFITFDRTKEWNRERCYLWGINIIESLEFNIKWNIQVWASKLFFCNNSGFCSTAYTKTEKRNIYSKEN